MENQSHSWLVEAMSTHRDYLRRFLIGLTRDMHLSEDLLQETYLSARAGASSYRGGDIRSWLCAIARNCFYAHARRKSFTSEEPLAEDFAADASAPGCMSHLDLIVIREAVAGLPSPLRQALLMKHYGGFTYKEIAERLSCPVGTAQQRVWSAINRLRRKLCITGEDVAVMSCDDVAGIRLLDYVCGSLGENERAEVERHLDKCPACQAELATLRSISAALDSVAGDLKVTCIVELDEEGIPTQYSWCRMTKRSEGQTETDYWEADDDVELLFAMAQGTVVEPQVDQFSDGRKSYTVQLDRAIKPGDVMDSLTVTRMHSDRWRANKLEDGTWRYEFGDTPNGAVEWMHFAALRLPPGAELVSADPAPNEVKKDGFVTLTWKGLLPKLTEAQIEAGDIWQFRSVVEYRLR